MNDVFFSIIIPLYNKEKFIKDTVSSVLEQTYPYWELLVINDGSTDNSLSEVESIKDSRIKIYTKENGGVSSARNYGIFQATCEYIAFLDADDRWDVDFLETLKRLIDTYQDAGMFSTCYKFSGKDNVNILPKTHFVPEIGKHGLINDYCKAAASGDPPVNASATCILKKAFKEVGYFPEGIKRGEDLDMWLRVACKYDIAYINIPKSSYMFDIGSNANKNFNSIYESFPYQKWYSYDYLPKKSLRLYSTSMLIQLLKVTLKNYRLIESFKIIYSMDKKSLFKFLKTKVGLLKNV